MHEFVEIKDLLFQGVRGQCENSQAGKSILFKILWQPSHTNILNSFKKSPVFQYILQIRNLHIFLENDNNKFWWYLLEIESPSNTDTLKTYSPQEEALSEHVKELVSLYREEQEHETDSFNQESFITPNRKTLYLLRAVTKRNDIILLFEIYDRGCIEIDRVDKVIALIAKLASKANEVHVSGQVTRVITDEFSFYPAERPYTLGEYKKIIELLTKEMEKLPPDIHLVLSTFPVEWLPNKLLSCGLYACSPQKNASPLLYHFSKRHFSSIDFTYVTKKNRSLEHIAEPNLIEKYSANILLQGTAVSLEDVNQFASAIKLTMSDGRSFITVIGICLDHSKGVECLHAHHLIDQLQNNNQTVPLCCSHVITSDSIHAKDIHVLSTVSHADTDGASRHANTSARFNPVLYGVYSDFSNKILTLENFPAKAIGVLRGDLLRHLLANWTEDECALYLNQQDKNGDTLAHLVVKQEEHSHELLAKRLYALASMGADLTIKNHHGISVQDIVFGKHSFLVSRAMCNALAWRDHIHLQNTSFQHDGCTFLTRLMQINNPDKDLIRCLILNGANPYKKDANGQCAIDLADNEMKMFLVETFRKIQYGYCSQTQIPLEQRTNWFLLPTSGQEEKKDQKAWHHQLNIHAYFKKAALVGNIDMIQFILKLNPTFSQDYLNTLLIDGIVADVSFYVLLILLDLGAFLNKVEQQPVSNLPSIFSEQANVLNLIQYQRVYKLYIKSLHVFMDDLKQDQQILPKNVTKFQSTVMGAMRFYQRRLYQEQTDGSQLLINYINHRIQSIQPTPQKNTHAFQHALQQLTIFSTSIISEKNKKKEHQSAHEKGCKMG